MTDLIARLRALAQGKDSRLAEHFKAEWEAADTLEARRWIPVSERLPERWQDCLAAFNMEGKPATVHGLLKWDGKLWRIGITDLVYTGTVTHWQPLPEPPLAAQGGTT